MTAIYFALGFLLVAVIVLSAGFLMLARQIGVLYERISPMGALVNDSGPQIGETTPIMTIPSLTGDSVTLGADEQASEFKAQLVFFVSPTCPVCKKLLPVVRSVQRDEADWLNVILASDGDPAQHRRFIESAGLADFPYVVSTELGLAYRVSRLPYAVLIDPQGVIRAKGLINNREQFESLFNALELNVRSVQEYLDKQKRGSDPVTVAPSKELI